MPLIIITVKKSGMEDTTCYKKSGTEDTIIFENKIKKWYKGYQILLCLKRETLKIETLQTERNFSLENHHNII